MQLLYNCWYDDEGNMISKTEISGSKTWTYTWDHRNRLVEIDYDSGIAGGQGTQYFQYDVFNRRTRFFWDASGQSYDKTWLYVYDGDDVVIDFFDGNTPANAEYGPLTKYLHGPAVDQVLAVEDLSKLIILPQRVLWSLTDQQNTLRYVAYNTGGTATSPWTGELTTYTYDPFGDPLTSSFTRYGYTGRESDTGELQYNRNRWYDPKIGRWLSEDPIGFNGDPSNLYRYVGNGPTNAVDPTGLVEGVGELHHTYHKVRFGVRKSELTRSQLEEALRNDLARFTFFNGGMNDIAAVRVSDGIAYFDLLGFPGWVSDWIILNDDQVAVQITATGNEVTGRMLFAHQLVGTRKWRFSINTTECNHIVTVETEAYERTRPTANWFGSIVAGEQAQLAIWTAYLQNIEFYYLSTYNGWNVEHVTGQSQWLGDAPNPW